MFLDAVSAASSRCCATYSFPVVTWDDEFVSEVSRTLKACQVFLAMPFFYLCYSQIDGNLGTVAAGMTLNVSVLLCKVDFNHANISSIGYS